MSQQAFQAVFGDKEYTVKIAMFNSEEDVIILKKNAVRMLEIDDNIFNPFHSGTILLTNDYNILENGKTPYVFLGNGSDMLYIDIQPNNGSERFLLSLRCVITEATEVVYDNSLCKKMSFVEYGQYALNSKYVNFMSVRSGAGAGSNADSALATGDIIKNTLNAVFENASNDLSLFDTDAQTGAPMFDAEGNSSGVVIPYNTMSYFLYLTYIMQLHSHQGSPCILTHDRFTKKFRLRALSKMFQDSEKLVVERFKFADPRQEPNQLIQPAIAFDPEPCSVHFGTDSEIAEFYTEAPASKNCIDHFAHEAVLSYSRMCNTFSYNMDYLNTESIKQEFQSLFVAPFKTVFSKYTLDANFYTIAQKDNWIDSQSSLPGELTQQQFKNLKLQSLLFMNYNYMFKTVGNTLRSSGTFVDVVKNKNASAELTRWDYNTLGRHFVTCVRHIFTQNTYMNQIETIKPYRLLRPGEAPKPNTALTDAGNSRASTSAPAGAAAASPEISSTTATNAAEYGFSNGTGNAAYNQNKAATRALIEKRLENSPLIGYVPADAAQYGVDGSKESWTNFMMKVVENESGFKTDPSSINTTDPGGGSYGLFQVSRGDGLLYRANPNGTNWTNEQLLDPSINVHTGVTIWEKNVLKSGRLVDPSSGKGAYTGKAGAGYFAAGTMRKIAKSVI